MFTLFFADVVHLENNTCNLLLSPLHLCLINDPLATKDQNNYAIHFNFFGVHPHVNNSHLVIGHLMLFCLLGLAFFYWEIQLDMQSFALTISLRWTIILTHSNQQFQNFDERTLYATRWVSCYFRKYFKTVIKLKSVPHNKVHSNHNFPMVHQTPRPIYSS